MVVQLLSDFISIGPRTSLYTPPSPVSGELVIICTWLGAARKHVAKYTSLYRRVAPGARILLVESNVPILVSSYARQRKHIQCAASIVLDALAECSHYNSMPPANNSSIIAPSPTDRKDATTTQPPKVLLHVFSNGGANTATQLLIVLRSHLRAPLPLAGLVLDSCPAKGTYWKSYNAMVLSLPQDAPTRLLGSLAVHFLLVLLYAWIASGNENPAGLMRRTMLDASTVSGAGAGDANGGDKTPDVARQGCYLYSDTDAMVEWSDISDHAADARRMGWKVREVRFSDSGHCQHLSMHEDRYVKVVEEIWLGHADDEKAEQRTTRRDARL